jgi:cell division protein ZapE
MTGPLAEYERRVASDDLRGDAAQHRVAAAFDRLFRDLVNEQPQSRGIRAWLRRRRGAKVQPVRGIYLWGSVGRGKTFLMDLFYACLPFAGKKRMHFHRFMAMVHERLKEHRNKRDPLDLVADELAAECRIICFDEFAVTDIADAMILGTLFRALFARGVSLAATSNTEPKRLYEGGLQRAQFLPAIALIEKHTEVVRMDGDLDYRLQFLQKTDLFQHPADEAANALLTQYFDAIAPDAEHSTGRLEILGRDIEYLRVAEDAIWFDFPQVCDGPRSQDDYIELARLYQSVVLSNVPQFTTLLENQARRFIALVDEFYDRRVKLVISAAVPVEQLYVGKRLAHEFGRTRSRLEEMQSLEYLHAAHRP